MMRGKMGADAMFPVFVVTIMIFSHYLLNPQVVFCLDGQQPKDIKVSDPFLYIH